MRIVGYTKANIHVVGTRYVMSDVPEFKKQVNKRMSQHISSLDRGTARRLEGSFGTVCGATAMN
jgi:hypothetical protein